MHCLNCIRCMQNSTFETGLKLLGIIRVMSDSRTYTRICAENRTIVIQLVFPAREVLSHKTTVSSNFQLSNILL